MADRLAETRERWAHGSLVKASEDIDYLLAQLYDNERVTKLEAVVEAAKELVDYDNSVEVSVHDVDELMDALAAALKALEETK